MSASTPTTTPATTTIPATGAAPDWPQTPARLEGSLLDYWRSRLDQHTCDGYAGIPLSKFPEDLRVYEHLLWAGAVTCVVEVGTNHGGSALWFLDRMRTFQGHGRTSGELCVISVDIDHTRARQHLGGVPDLDTGIVLVERDVRAPGLLDLVAPHVPAGANVMLVEDGAHTEETTFAALEQLAALVTPGGFLVVEDGVVDIEPLRIHAGWPSGVLPAVERWRATPEGAMFAPRPDLEIYGLTSHPRGFFQRVAAS